MAHQVLTNEPPTADLLSLTGDQIDFYVWDPENAQIQALLPQIEGIFLRSHLHIDGAFMDRLPALKVISNTGVGVDHINLDDARARGIPVGNTPSVLNGAVADMAFALMLAFSRNLVPAANYACSPKFTTYEVNAFLGHEVHSTTLGIIGLGKIGQEIAKRAQGFGMSILYYNRHRDPYAEQTLEAVYCPLSELLSRSDYVVLMVPLTSETRHMIGQTELRQMKSSAVLVNMARGGVVDHDALVIALQKNWIRGAALDVTEPEPLPRDHPLLTIDNVLILPHLGSATVETRQAMLELSVANLFAGLRGEALPARIA